ncbi:efflux RND transporter periplasmic adaptor subunit [Actinoplanes auranticolor]|uniref:efflux RND transporter periplasmic adaptor subunit n=1 Tax=Actinoplanes auranticolor TaxID=47988 RepID=UPI001FE5218C|nr:efflux RND transporter periplasmic adaptor subunit [Actinoplanes auranticolor]
MSRPHRRARTLLVAFVLLPPLTAASCGDEPSALTVGAAAMGTVAEIVEASGSVTARAAATVTSPAEGTLAELRFDAGDQVRKGQVVAVVDSPAAERRLEQAARALDAASSGGVPSTGGTAGFAAAQHRTDQRADKAFTDARDAAEKVTDAELKTALLAQVKAAQQQYEAASDAAGAALRSVQRGVAGLGQAVNALGTAQRLQAQQAYDLAEAAVDALTLRAPVSGVVQLGGTAPGGTSALTDLLADPASAAAAGAPAQAPVAGVDSAVPQGATVGAGTPILTIVDTGRLGLAAEVDETDVLLVQAGGKATAELDAATGATYEAGVRAVDLLPTTSARGGVSYRVRLSLGKGRYADGRAAPTPRPGMSAIVRLQVREAEDAVTVPASAVVSADGRDTVWTVRGGKAERVPVTIGVQGEDVVQVVSGVGAGQQIIVGGADQVSPGQTVS